MPSRTSVAYSNTCPPMKKAPITNVMVNQRRRPLTSPRSAANTPSWQATDEETRTKVLKAEKANVRLLLSASQTTGPWTARTVKYIANRAAKNMSSEESQTMVPTATLLGLADVSYTTGTEPGAVAVATRRILPGQGPGSDPDPPFFPGEVSR